MVVSSSKQLSILHRETPLINGPQIFKNKGAGLCETFFKLDNLQESQSFKLRGLGYSVKIELEKNPNLAVLISSSGGNAGLAATVVANHYGLSIIVFVPETTSQMAQQVLQTHGAQVIVKGKVWDEAHQAAIECFNGKGAGSAFLVHPFEGENTWKGHSSLVKEIWDQHVIPDVIICSVGGGGLLNGIITGLLEMIPQPNTIVVAVETEGAASFAAAVAQNQLVTIPAITSIAKSLGARTVSAGTLELRKRYGKEKVRSLVLSDQAALQAVVTFANDFKMLVEPACGAALAPVLVDPSLLLSCVPELIDRSESAKIVVEVCGGFAVTLEMIEEWRKQI